MSWFCVGGLWSRGGTQEGHELQPSVRELFDAEEAKIAQLRP